MEAKRFINRTIDAALLAVLVSALSVGRAEAYVDPGTGSYLFQISIGALVGALYAAKVYWGRIKGLFGRPSKGASADDSE